ncbi:MAG: hypothetical protein ACI9DF_004084 [Verrucomicrobiales bacterium]|jgi:hypothetical protein
MVDSRPASISQGRWQKVCSESLSFLSFIHHFSGVRERLTVNVIYPHCILMKSLKLSAFALVCFIAMGLTWAADEANPVSITPVPVDDDMHHLMEYVFAPAYKRLQFTFAEDAGKELPWKAIKGDALTLAEATNLLLHRAPEKDANKWLELAVQTRAAGAKLYKAAADKSGELPIDV